MRRSARRRIRSLACTTTTRTPSSCSQQFSLQLDDAEFSFDSSYTSSSPASDASDLESLPDLTEDDSTPNTSPIKDPVTRSYYFQDLMPLKPISFETTRRDGPSIFEIPEIVHKILEFADIQSTVIPQEHTPIRRKPLSFNHALLIHGSKHQAELALNDQLPDTINDNYETTGVLYNCLQVNRLFKQVATEVLRKKFFFSDEFKLYQFLSNPPDIKFKPTVFVLHKLFQVKQQALDRISFPFDFSDLEWLELYMCPKLIPGAEFFKDGHKLKKLIITGSKVIDDEFLKMVSHCCPNLEVLDIRACELVSDAGVYQIAKRCHKLTTINLGRKQRGYLITDHSLTKLIKNNSKLETVGLAGCHISDKFLWDLATVRSDTLQRLSLNNCPLISNQSIPLILSSTTPYFHKLSVLELRFNYQITVWQPVIEFKRRQEFRGISLLLEVCETLMLRVRQQEMDMDKVISQRIFKDILDWANEANDGDSSFHELLSSRRQVALV
ncbi:uncharacterized protein RJT20DRAFT_93403 [Scheffersomyces xylosifermentans]|uniref:uncharacterized protein n=1 Tax=Scheffersomyces xylosifermentans TaxID=1304137 RepID=UPI00315CFEF8